MLTFIAPLLLLSAIAGREAPVGTRLHIRLTAAVGSYASKVGVPLRARLIAPVVVGETTLLRAGSTLSGRVTFVSRVGLGIVHETAAIGLEFSEILLPGGQRASLAARVEEVDNGRERVTKDGRIHGQRPTSSLCYRTSGYVRSMLLWSVHAEVAEWAIKTLLVQLPEPEIYYPPGAELTLILTAPLHIDPDPEAIPATHRLDEEERADIADWVAEMPLRATAPVSHRPSDIVNAVLIGSREQIASAFVAAGWAEARPSSFRASIRDIRAVAEGHGFHSAPMSSQFVNGAEADMSWEKGFNDLSKRHHIRIWKQPGTWHGEEIWIGAATRDIDFAYLRPGQRLTHRVEQNIDQERDKVAYDLEFTSCVEGADWLDRPGVPRSARNATGDLMSTDGRVAVLRFNGCQEPRLSTETVDESPLAMRGGALYRFARREILSVRSDLLRSNIYWRTFEGARLIFTELRRRRQQRLEARLQKPV